VRGPVVLALAAALLAPAVVASAAKPARPYSGTTSIDTHVGFRLSAGQVRGFAIAYVAPCDDGETLRGTFRFKPAKVTDGRFVVKGPSSGALADGRTTASQLRLGGRFTGRRARGAFSITTQLARLDGQGVTTCRSCRVTWKASRTLS